MTSKSALFLLLIEVLCYSLTSIAAGKYNSVIQAARALGLGRDRLSSHRKKGHSRGFRSRDSRFGWSKKGGDSMKRVLWIFVLFISLLSLPAQQAKPKISMTPGYQ
jgi:hypothetical protein